MGYEIHENEVVYLDDAGTKLAEVTFPPAAEAVADVVDINHTFVDPSLRGRGVAGELMSRAAASIRETGRRARPTCSYAVKWFEKHPDERDVLA